MTDASDIPRVPAAPRDAAGAASAGRTRLREFQAGLAERLRNARVAPVGQNRLGFVISGQHYLIDLSEAGEIVPVPELTPVPLTRPWFRGLANLRGNLVTVIDLAQFAGAEPTVLDRDSRVLTFGADLQCNAGILVTRMLGLRNVAQMQPEATGADLAAWREPAMVDAQGLRWLPLSLARLSHEERFLQAGI